MSLRGHCTSNLLALNASIEAARAGEYPLFTTGYHPPPEFPQRRLRSVGPDTPPPPTVRPLAHHKISQTLLLFVQPLIPELEELDPDGMMMMLELAVTTWNAVVLDTWEPGRGRVGAARAAVRSLPWELSDWMLPFFESLVERKQQNFQGDWRLMGGLEVRWSRDGEPRIRLQGRLPVG